MSQEKAQLIAPQGHFTVPGLTVGGVGTASSFSGNCGGVKTDGTLWSWGYNSMGGLAQNNTTKYSSPVQIPGTNWTNISVTNYRSHYISKI